MMIKMYGSVQGADTSKFKRMYCNDALEENKK